MKALHGFVRRQALTIIGSLTLASTAYTAQPPDVVVSDGNGNTAMGTDALASLTTGEDNTAAGLGALVSNTIGSSNTAFGNIALQNNATGNNNVAVGQGALFNNMSGSNNAAVGQSALLANIAGVDNAAFGAFALAHNGGSWNTASGAYALNNNGGNYNSAAGFNALYYNTTGSYNTASGAGALYFNAGGNDNTASGYQALRDNTTGSSNTAYGFNALYSNTTGGKNIAIGQEAGHNLTTGSSNIDIGAAGSAGESGKIRIGTEGTQTGTFIAGIYNVTTVTAGLPVLIDSAGQLGTVSSSARFKADIAPMGASTAKLQQLHPVTFRYKADSQGTLRYGLIAEQVANVYPELVVRDKDGRIDGVRYDELAPMLLNEIQKEQTTIATLAAQHESDAGRISSLEQQLASIKTALSKLQSEDKLVAQR